MKKYVWIFIVVFVAGCAAYFFSKLGSQSYAVGSPEWKYETAETETQERPARFEDMKWNEPQGVDVRAPASTEGK